MDPKKVKEMEELVAIENAETFPTKIMLARRGNCSFVNKVRNAERAGASLLVVVDNQAEKVSSIIMGDDGTGSGIRIPAMLIGKGDGEKLIGFAKQRQGATLSAEFAVKEKSSKVDLEFWYSSNNQLALDFIKEFDRYAHKLDGYINITPRFVTWGCPVCTEDFKKEECFGSGQYCAPNHVKDDFNRVKGRDIIMEDLRQSCLHTNLLAKGKEARWWDYMKEVHSECFGFISEACSKRAHEIKGFNWEETQKCVQESFLNYGDGTALENSENTLLRDNAKQWKEYGTLYWPSVTINKVTFRGDITPENILEDVCAHLTTKPEVCINFYKREHIVYEDTSILGPDTVSAELLILVVVILIGVNVILILAYRRCVKKEMEDTMGYKVSNAVSQYISVAQSANGGRGSNTSLEMD